MRFQILIMLAALTMGAHFTGCTEDEQLALENAQAVLCESCDPCEEADKVLPSCEDVPADYACSCVQPEPAPEEWEPAPGPDVIEPGES